MATVSHVFPSFTQAMASHSVNLTADTLKVGLASGTFNWVTPTQAYSTVTQFLNNSGAGGGGALTEVVYTGATPATRVTLASTSITETALVSSFTCANPVWSGATWTANYAFFYDYTAGGNSDANGLLMCYWDFGGAQTVSGQSFTLIINPSGLVTWTSS